MVVELPDDAFIAATRSLFKTVSEKDLEFVFTPEAAAVDDFFIRTLNYYLAMVPWIEDVFPLSAARVLEIGFGSGASTLAVAHKCKSIAAFDIDPTSSANVMAKVKAHELKNVSLNTLDPEWATPSKIQSFVDNHSEQYDVILLAAVVEHMTLEERLTALKALWSLLRPSGVMVIYDTPNRLYPFDMHSFRLPFFDWLPEELAIPYASKSPRKDLLPLLDDATDKRLALYRIGRGASFHEFEMAIGLGELDVINDGYSRHISHRKRNTVAEGLLVSTLDEFAPQVSPGFGKAFLELILRKKWEAVTVASRKDVVDDVSPSRRAYMRMEGPEAFLSIDVKAKHPQRHLVIDVLKHAWSGTLCFYDQREREFHREPLFQDYQGEAIVEVALPSDCCKVKIGLLQDERAAGIQAWLFGLGTR